MDGLALLAEARDAGLEVRARGDRLVIRGPRKCEAMAKVLLEHKPEVLAALVTPCEARAEFKERATTLERDAGKSRAEAERMAHEAALNRWQNDHPPAHADQDRCAACGGWLLDDLLPLAERDVHGRPVWVHAGCWREYVRKRRAEAVEALATAGLVSPGASGP